MQHSKKTQRTAVQIEEAKLTLLDCGEQVPLREILTGSLFIDPGDNSQTHATFTKALPQHKIPNAMIFKGRYLKCRLKKNGNYQVTSCMSPQTLETWRDADGKVNLTEIYRHQTAELQRILIIIEKRHSTQKGGANE